jgi:DNA-binding MarR family transcriptional regulator
VRQIVFLQIMNAVSQTRLRQTPNVAKGKSAVVPTAKRGTAMKREATTDRLERSPVHLLHRAGQCAGDVFHAEMSDGDLTPRQFAVLVTVSQHEGVSQTGLVERTGIDRSTLADIVRRMLKKGLLQRRRTKEDARAYAVKLTEEGRRILRSSDPLAKKVDERILEALPSKQREQFLEDLRAIVETLSRMSSAVGTR